MAASRASSVIWTRWCASYRSRRPRRISRASGLLGGATTIVWNRRSSAPSFSMYLRYSSRVVAPMHWTSPRARAGLSTLEASIAPSAARRAPRRAFFLDVLAFLVRGRGADALALAAGQGRLEHVGGVDRPLGAAGADE